MNGSFLASGTWAAFTIKKRNTINNQFVGTGADDQRVWAVQTALPLLELTVIRWSSGVQGFCYFQSFIEQTITSYTGTQYFLSLAPSILFATEDLHFKNNTYICSCYKLSTLPYTAWQVTVTFLHFVFESYRYQSKVVITWSHYFPGHNCFLYQCCESPPGRACFVWFPLVYLCLLPCMFLVGKE